LTFEGVKETWVFFTSEQLVVRRSSGPYIGMALWLKERHLFELLSAMTSTTSCRSPFLTAVDHEPRVCGVHQTHVHMSMQDKCQICVLQRRTVGTFHSPKSVFLFESRKNSREESDHEKPIKNTEKGRLLWKPKHYCSVQGICRIVRKTSGNGPSARTLPCRTGQETRDYGA
jgi:hypothetical protein